MKTDTGKLLELLQDFDRGPDRSLRTANEAESALIEFLQTEAGTQNGDLFDDLQFALAMYRPGGEFEMWDESTVLPIVRRAIRFLLGEAE